MREAEYRNVWGTASDFGLPRIYVLKGSGRAKAERYVWEGGLFTDPVSLPQGPWLPAKEGRWPLFYRLHGAKEDF